MLQASYPIPPVNICALIPAARRTIFPTVEIYPPDGKIVIWTHLCKKVAEGPGERGGTDGDEKEEPDGETAHQHNQRDVQRGG
jgi:hypothetical protein